jgi:hypothetical protein
MDARTVQHVLAAHGFPCGKVDGIIGPRTRAAVARFQSACNVMAPWLTIDGIPGPKTQAALAELPRLSEHFTVAELRCRHCGESYVRRELLAALEGLRDELGRPIVIRSAYRCPHHNNAVGGARASMHLHGLAADVAHPCTVDEARTLELFSGIGDKGGLVAHVDLRHLSPENQTPHATPANPARWHY